MFIIAPLQSDPSFILLKFMIGRHKHQSNEMRIGLPLYNCRYNNFF